LGAFFDNHATDFMTQDIALRQKTASHQGVVGAAKPRIGDFDKDLVGCQCVIRDLFIDESPVFTKYDRFHKLSFL
jgi:hypothetical protein